MQKSSKLLTDSIIAVATLAAVMCSATFLADKVINSPVYRQSRIVPMLVRQENLGISGMLENTQNIELVIKFAGALATAYINFEMIPVGEATTFVAIFESLNENVDIEQLEYHRKDLSITGTAVTQADYENFLEALRGRGHFAALEGGCYDSTNGGVSFEILGVSSMAETHLNFQGAY